MATHGHPMIIVDIRRAKASPVFAGLGPPAKKKKKRNNKN